MAKSKVPQKGLQSNLDKRLSDSTIKQIERKERRTEFIDERYKTAESSLLDGTDAPDVIYDGLQKSGVYSADPEFDKSRESIVGMKSLPIKEYNVMPDGTFGITLAEGSAALEELRAGKFCHACHDRQPEMPEMWEHIIRRLEDRIGKRPAWGKHAVMCCYCGARLGIEGDFKQEVSSITQVTPDQRELLQSMFGQIRQPDE